MSWNKWSQMFHVSNGSDTWTTSTMWNGESLMEIQMANISSDQTWRGKTKLSIHIGTIHVNLSSVMMNCVADFLDISLEHTMG